MPEARSFNTMFITPAMASEPYWAAAPSRSTSIRSIAAAGIAFRSTPTVPRPNVPLTCTNALEWRRLPLTSTSTWSGPRPRRLAGLMWSEPSEMVWCDARSEEHTSELQSLAYLVCRLLLEKKKNNTHERARAPPKQLHVPLIRDPPVNGHSAPYLSLSREHLPTSHAHPLLSSIVLATCY